MSYRSATVASVVNDVNQRLFLPAIQRPYVWEPDQVVALFDSLLKGYPISTFLFWALRPENRSNWEIYKFVEHFRYGDTHNEIADPDGRDMTLVLDGQQRLTSLLIGLRGSYTVKLKNKRWDNPAAWERRRLYINLLKDPATEDQEDRENLGITYGLKFAGAEPANKEGELWIKVGSILDCSDMDKYDEFKDRLLAQLPDSVTRGQERTLERNLDRLYRTVWQDQVVAFYTETNQSYDRVLDIFIRANDGGTKLSKSDLLLSMITSKWDGVNAREEIFEFVERLNTQLDRKNDFDKDFIMRACLVLSDLDHVYKVSNFTRANLEHIQGQWPDIRRAIEATVKLVNRFGIDRDTLTSYNALLPIAYYLHKLRDRDLEDSSSFSSRNRSNIRMWLLGALLNNVFGGNSDQTIGVCRAVIRESLQESEDFPHRQLSDSLLKRRGRVITFNEDNTGALLETRYGQRTAFLALSVLYDEHHWGVSLYHIDHIIPRALCSARVLGQRGIDPIRIKRIQESVDRLGNLQLLPARENQEKSDKEFSEWLLTRDDSFLERHLIPRDRALWCPERLPEFVEAREELVRERLRSNSSHAQPLQAGSDGSRVCL